MMKNEDKIAQIREKALNDLFFFAKEILGYSLMQEKPHRELCDLLSKKNKKSLVLLPRGCFKSTIGTIAYTLWRLVKDPDLRVLISSETFSQSKTFVSAMKSHITDNLMFKTIFGEMKKDDSTWRAEEFTVAGRTKVAREPSVLASGVGQVKTGLHFDLIILDDVVSDKNINTNEQIQKTLNHYRLLLSILEPGGEMLLIGTRYHFNDLYGHILENEARLFTVLIRSAIDENENLYFPTRLTKKFLEEQKKSQGTNVFSNQYMNNCLDQETATFQKKWIRFFINPPEKLRKFLLLDPASTDNKKSDFSGIVICGVDTKNNIFVLEAINNKSTIGEMINLVFEKVAFHQINVDGSVAIEISANQQTYSYIFNEEMQKRNFYFPITELVQSTDRSKLARIKGLQPWFENGKVYLRKDQTELYDQLTMFPRVKNDDLCDALSFILKVMVPAVEEKEPEDTKWEKLKEEKKLSNNEVLVWKNKDELAKRMVRRTKYYRC